MRLLLARLFSLWQRFIAVRAARMVSGPVLLDQLGQLIGNVDMVSLGGSEIAVSGWTSAGRVELHADGMKVVVQPTLMREDVAHLTGGNSLSGFRLRLPIEPARADLVLFSDGDNGEPIAVVPLRLPAGQRSRLWLCLSFLWSLGRAAPIGLRWYLTRREEDRGRFLTVMGLRLPERVAALDKGLFAPATTPPRLPSRVTIVMPVYNAFDLLQEALARVRVNTDLPWRLILVEDRSSDTRVAPFLRDWVAGCKAAPDRSGEAVLLENPDNLGFVGAANRGLAYAGQSGDHVILLNSDALVPPGWASRLLRPILADLTVATVTPMSNDAEIFSVPVICRRMDLEPGVPDRMDEIARQMNPSILADVPTGVGFCMAVNANFLSRVPQFDTAFGRGYGEEVDWCQKILALGGRNVGIGSLFVEHRGGASFGSASKSEMIAHNHRLIQSRYRSFDAQVQDFVTRDPLSSARITLAIAMVGAWGEVHDRPLPLFIAHSLGGGAEKYLERRIALDLDQSGRPSVVLRVGGAERWRLDVCTSNGVISGETGDFDLILALLAPLRRREVIYSCGVGDADPIHLPSFILALAGREAEEGAGPHRLDVLMHDFFPISPSYTLLDGDGIYRGPVLPGRDMTAAGGVHRARDPAGGSASLAAWQDAWGRMLAAADEITVFSEDSRDQVLAVWPGLSGQIMIRPHELLTLVPVVTPPAAGQPRVIGVLGAIGLQKGAAVLRDLARRSGQGQDLRLVLIGYIDLAYALPDTVPVHGAYQIEDIPALVSRYGITDWLVPSIWPETFSFTTHEALATGLPVWAFDIGAQGEAVTRAKNGRPIQYIHGEDPAQSVYAALTQDLKIGSAVPQSETEI